MQKGFIVGALIIVSFFVAFAFKTKIGKPNLENELSHYQNPANTVNDIKLIESSRIVQARQFCKKYSFNNCYAFFIDMSRASGSSRFFIYDFQKDSITAAGLVTHGNCNQYWLEGRKYGNTVGCGCTSLGKYKIGKPYNGKFGLAYKLYGLDSTNNNAFNRFVVLHSHPCVPATEIKDDICQSNGCPTVNPSFLAKLQLLIDKSRQPVLLWIYE